MIKCKLKRKFNMQTKLNYFRALRKIVCRMQWMDLKFNMTGVLVKRRPCKEVETQRKDYVKAQGEQHLQAKECLRPPRAMRDMWNRLSLTELRKNKSC